MLFGHTFCNTVPVGATAGILQPYEMWSGMTAYKFHRSIRYIYEIIILFPPSATLTHFLSYRSFLIISQRGTSLDTSVSVKCQSLTIFFTERLNLINLAFYCRPDKSATLHLVTLCTRSLHSNAFTLAFFLLPRILTWYATVSHYVLNNDLFPNVPWRVA